MGEHGETWGNMGKHGETWDWVASFGHLSKIKDHSSLANFFRKMESNKS